MVLNQFLSTLLEISNSVSGKPSVRIELELVGEEHQLAVRFDWWKENYHAQRVFSPAQIRSAQIDLLYHFVRQADHAYIERAA